MSEELAKIMADKVGHGMSEKCEFYARNSEEYYSSHFPPDVEAVLEAARRYRRAASCRIPTSDDGMEIIVAIRNLDNQNKQGEG